MPSKDELRYEGPGTYTSGNPIHSAPGGAHAGKDYERAEHFADAHLVGYRLAGRLDYLNAIGAWNMSPRFAGSRTSRVSPGPGGNFVEGLYALTLGLNFNYQARWEIGPQLQHVRRCGPLEPHQRPRLRRVVGEVLVLREGRRDGHDTTATGIAGMRRGGADGWLGALDAQLTADEAARLGKT